MTRYIPRGSSIIVLVLVALAPVAVYSQRVPGDAPAQPGGVKAKVEELLLAEPLESAPEDDALRSLMKQRHNAALRVLRVSIQQYRTGVPGVDPAELQSRYFVAVHRVAECQMDLAKNQKERVEVLDRIFALALQQEQFARAHVAVGKASEVEVDRALYERLDAQIKVSRERDRK